MSQAVGVRWFRDAGGMPPFMLAAVGPLSVVRGAEEIALLAGRRAPVSARSPAARAVTVDDLAGVAPQRRHPRRQARVPGLVRAVEGGASRTPKIAKLAANERLREYVQERLAGEVQRPDGTVPGPATGRGRAGTSRTARTAGGSTAWSPEQIPHRLKVDFPDDESMRICHEAIYQALYVAGPRRAQA